MILRLLFHIIFIYILSALFIVAYQLSHGFLEFLCILLFVLYVEYILLDQNIKLKQKYQNIEVLSYKKRNKKELGGEQ